MRHRIDCAAFFIVLEVKTMIVVLKHNVPEEKRNQLINWLRSQRIDVHPSLGEYQTVLGLVGDTSRIDMSLLESLDIVDSVKRVSDPFKCCNRKFHPDDTVVSVGDAKFGGGHFAMIAGPCSVESEEQIVYVAKAVKAAGAQLLRGGAFKPRTSPYDCMARVSACLRSPSRRRGCLS
jgi:3-deoxy-7-phosphoheptulonate synthase